jgi:glyoxylase-like metal-dependent hydrolase (beta-lactamase superfamily II)
MAGRDGMTTVGRRAFLRASIIAMFGVACSAPPPDPGPAPAAGAQVGRFASDNPGSVNTWWLGAPDGVIVIDSGRNVAGGRRAVDQIGQTGLPVAAVLVTHPHPDHVGGLGVFRGAYPNAPIYASEATAQWMRADPLGFYPLARQADPDYPATLTHPDETFGPGAVLDIAGMRLETAEFGPGESETATAYYEPRSGTLFSGDLINNHATPALLEGHTCGWLGNLDQLSARFPDATMIYPGHGEPGEPAALIEAQRGYLAQYRELVAPAVSPHSADGADVGPGEQAVIVERLDREYPGYERVASLPTLQELNIHAVAAEMRGKAGPGC